MHTFFEVPSEGLRRLLLPLLQQPAEDAALLRALLRVYNAYISIYIYIFWLNHTRPLAQKWTTGGTLAAAVEYHLIKRWEATGPLSERARGCEEARAMGQTQTLLRPPRQRLRSAGERLRRAACRRAVRLTGTSEYPIDLWHVFVTRSLSVVTAATVLSLEGHWIRPKWNGIVDLF